MIMGNAIHKAMEFLPKASLLEQKELILYIYLESALKVAIKENLHLTIIKKIEEAIQRLQ